MWNSGKRPHKVPVSTTNMDQDQFLMDPLSFAFLLVIIYLLLRIFNITSRAEKPAVLYNDSKLNEGLIRLPTLRTVYQPTFLWGKSGHIQTLFLAKIGRFLAPKLQGKRYQIIMSDGATSSFDVFEAASSTQHRDFTVCVAPGIANSSETVYIQTFIQYAIDCGYRVAVLNHLGALKNVCITSPRIFTYGNTEEYRDMVEKVRAMYPNSKLIALGFSMGANLVIKYLGESPYHQKMFVCALSICQGYDVVKSKHVLNQWTGLRRVYNFMITLNMKNLIERNRDILFGNRPGFSAGDRERMFDEDKIKSATSLLHIDEHLTRKMSGFDNVDDFYEWCSSSFYLNKLDSIPVLLLNSEDDPLIPPLFWKTPIAYVSETDQLDQASRIFVTTKHGGHLGYFEGGLLWPNTYSWLDRMIIEYIDAVIPD